MSQQEQDFALVKQVQNGNKQAFNILVAKYQSRVKQLVARFVRDADEQDDVVQDAFIKTYRALHNFRGDSAFYTWLYRIAVNTAKNHLAVKARQNHVSDEEIADFQITQYAKHADNVVELNSPLSQLENDLVVKTIRQVVEKLPADLREAIELREFEGLSYEEIAQVMQCPVGTVRSRIFRAREAIETALKGLE